MSESARFFLTLAASAVVAAAAILALRSRRATDVASGVFLALCLVPSAAVLAARLSILAGFLESAPATQITYSGARWVVLGAAAAAAAISSLSARGAALAFVRAPVVLRGLCLFAALSYFAIEAGKLAHDAEMREFFTASGYPVAMMYAVMAAETVGAVGLLVPRARLAAAAGLSVLMAGAIGTHAKNGDPFSDSLDAVRFLVLLGAIAALASAPRLRESNGRPSSSSRRS
jgi:uncharacterized membrane protein YphA (DoxX/SURF4 family)